MQSAVSETTPSFKPTTTPLDSSSVDINDPATNVIATTKAVTNSADTSPTTNYTPTTAASTRASTTTIAIASNDAGEYSSPEGDFKLTWTESIDTPNAIDFTMSATTTGWLGIGFSDKLESHEDADMVRQGLLLLVQL